MTIRKSCISSLTLLTLIAVVFCSVVLGQNAPALSVLLKPYSGPRSLATGSLLTASADDANSILLNPAGLAFEPYRELLLSYDKYLLDMDLSNISYALPYRKTGFAVGIKRFNGGTLYVMQNGVSLGSLPAQLDEMATLSFGTALWDNFALGVNGKIFRTTILDKYTATGTAYDIGTLWSFLDTKISLGLAVRNIGSAIQYRTVQEDLPLNSEIAGGLKLLDTYTYKLSVGAGITYEKLGDTVYNLGTEFQFSDMLSLRASCNLDKIYGNTLCAGFGIRFINNSIDYAWSGINDLDNLHHLAMTIRFDTAGIFGKGEGYIKKGMYSRAYHQLTSIPEKNSHYLKARTLIKENEGNIFLAKSSRQFRDALLATNQCSVAVQTMKSVPVSIYSLLPQLRVPPITVVIKNNSKQKKDFMIVYRFIPITDEQITRITVEPGKQESCWLFPILPSARAAKVQVSESDVLHLRVYSTGTDNKKITKVCDDFMENITFCPNNQYFTQIKNSSGSVVDVLPTLCSWVTYNDPSMSIVLTKASDRGLRETPAIKIVGAQDPSIFAKAQEQTEKDYFEQIRIIYETLKEDYNITYLNNPVAERGEFITSQRVKFPAQTLLEKGNCIELSVLFASLLEGIDINPIIVLLPSEGHCVVGWEIPGSTGSRYRLLETNLFGEYFEKVVGLGKSIELRYGLTELFDNGIPFDSQGIYKKDKDVIILNIKMLRKYFPPSKLFLSNKSYQ